MLLAKLSSVAFFLENPIILTVACVTATLHQLAEEATEVIIVGLFFEIQITAVLEVLRELLGALSSQLLDRGLNLLFLNSVILIVFIFTGEALPRKRSLEEVEQDVTDGLHVVSPSLLNADMSVD